MSDHDCTGCWRYNPDTDREECIVCGAVRAPRVATDGGETVDDLLEGMYGELDTVFGRYNDLVRVRPDLVVALLINMADGLRSKFNIEIEATRLADQQYAVYVDGEHVAGFLGFERHDDGRIVDADMPDGMEGEPIEDEPDLVTDGGQLVSEPDADLDALGQVTCVNCEVQLDLAETARFARVGELESGWLCPDCDEALCDRCDGRGRVPFPIAGTLDCPDCEGGDPA